MRGRWVVTQREAGQRLDRALSTIAPKMTRHRAKSLLDAGRISVGGKRVVIAGWKVAVGDRIDIVDEQPLARGRAKPRAAPERECRAHSQKLRIYHEDRDLLVVEKPAGIVTVPAAGQADGSSLLGLVKSYLRRRHPERRASFCAALHRLDAETSGIMVFALSREGERLTEQFHDHRIERLYEALVSGRVEKEQGRITASLTKGNFTHGRKVATDDAGKKAITDFRVLERYASTTLLAITVHTGRTHQIRVHLAGEGHPVLGDAVYGAERSHTPIDRHIQGALRFRRHALHATGLAFRHPVTGKRLSFRSKLPRDLKALVDILRMDAVSERPSS